MKVFKFGGASVKDSKGVKNVALILQSYTRQEVIIVISAMGKTTNALERVLNDLQAGRDHQPALQVVKEYHAAIMQELFPQDHAVWKQINNLWSEAEDKLRKNGGTDQLRSKSVV